MENDTTGSIINLLLSKNNQSQQNYKGGIKNEESIKCCSCVFHGIITGCLRRRQQANRSTNTAAAGMTTNQKAAADTTAADTAAAPEAGAEVANKDSL